MRVEVTSSAVTGFSKSRDFTIAMVGQVSLKTKDKTEREFQATLKEILESMTTMVINWINADEDEDLVMSVDSLKTVATDSKEVAQTIIAQRQDK